MVSVAMDHYHGNQTIAWMLPGQAPVFVCCSSDLCWKCVILLEAAQMAGSHLNNANLCDCNHLNHCFCFWFGFCEAYQTNSHLKESETPTNCFYTSNSMPIN